MECKRVKGNDGFVVTYCGSFDNAEPRKLLTPGDEGYEDIYGEPDEHAIAWAILADELPIPEPAEVIDLEERRRRST